LMWCGLGLVGLSIIVIAASIVAPGVVGFEASGSGLLEGSAPRDADAYSGFNTTQAEAMTFARANQLREDRGLQPFTAHPQLTELAASHTANMAEVGYYSHKSPDGQTFATRSDRTAPACSPSSENIHQAPMGGSVRIYGGERTVSTYSERGLATYLIQGWLNSAEHRENLLARDMNRAAISIRVSEDNKIYATMTFGRC